MNKHTHQPGFTIIELLVVIVVIGILAAITAVSYVGVTNQAIIASLKSDLGGASKLLKMYAAEHGGYPTTINNSTYCPRDSLGAEDVAYCLKASQGNILYYINDGDDFILTIEHSGTDVKYDINSGGQLEEVATTELQMGDTYRGGIIAYILKDGDVGYTASVQHGLIVAPMSTIVSRLWGCPGQLIGTSTGSVGGVEYSNTLILGTGRANTNKVVAGCIETNTAAKYAVDLDINGYNDWYLPSSGELWVIRNHDPLPGFLVDAFHWSSSESTVWGSPQDYVSTIRGACAGCVYRSTKSYTAPKVQAIRTF